MDEMDKILNSFKKEVVDLFEYKEFIVKIKATETCDHIFLPHWQHESLRTVNIPNEVHPVISIQKSSNKIRLRFPYHQLERYEGLNNALEQEMEKKRDDFSCYYNSLVDNDAMCFDFYDDVEYPRLKDKALVFVTRLINIIKKAKT
jgi:hypothetical protein